MTGRLDGVRRTPQGGILASANLTRTGVFTYHNADGSKTRELRHPDDVFKSDALETLKLAPLTIGHPGMVTPENYKTNAVGIVASDVHADGKFVKATILIQDAEACARVELGATDPNDPNALLELSCGYEVDVQPADGEFEGETFDSKQVGHKYNHVALLPLNAGRAGGDVRITLDEAGNVRADSYCPDMTIKTDALPSETQARLDALTGERDALKIALDATKAELDAAKGEVSRITADSAKLIDPARVAELVASRVSLESSARAVLGSEFKASKTDDKGKTEPMSDREIMLATIAKVDPKFDAKDRSDDYVRARFDGACEHASKTDAAVVELGKAANPGALEKVTNAKSALDAAHEKAEAQRLEEAKGGAPAGAITRKH